MMKKKRNEIYGMMMRPVSTNAEDNEKTVQSSVYSVKEHFYNSYRHHIAAMQIVAECAKVYITKNWEQVKDWSDLEVIMEDANTPKDKEFADYFKYVGKSKENSKRWNSDVMSKFLEKKDEEDKLRHNPILKVEGVVLDPTDGDFSLTVNGRNHMWISDSTVVIIADYIEQQLVKEKLIELSK